MKKLLKLGLLSVLSGCMQPGNIEIIKPSVVPVVKASVIPQVSASVKPAETVSNNSVPVNVNSSTNVQTDGSLISKGGEPSNAATPIPTPTAIIFMNTQPTVPTSTPSATPYISYNTGGTNVDDTGPIKPEDRGHNMPEDICTAYGQTSQKCLDFRESEKPPKPAYNIVDPVPSGLNTSTIYVNFKDEYRVRYNRTENKFISLNGTDVSSINLMLTNNPNVYQIYGSSLSEETANRAELSQESACSCDIRNSNSGMFLYVRNTDIAEFVNTLRNNPLVREANLSMDSGGAAGGGGI